MIQAPRPIGCLPGHEPGSEDLAERFHAPHVLRPERATSPSLGALLFPQQMARPEDSRADTLQLPRTPTERGARPLPDGDAGGPNAAVRRTGQANHAQNLAVDLKVVLGR